MINTRARGKISESDQSASVDQFRVMLERQFAERGAAGAALARSLIANVQFPEFYPEFGLLRPGPERTILVQRFMTVSEMLAKPAGLTDEAIRRGSAECDVFSEEG